MGGVFLTVSDEEYLAPVYEVRNAVFIVAAAGFVVALILFILFAGTITKPIRKGVQFATEISESLLYTRIDVEQKDEIGVLADSLRNMRNKLRDVVSNVYNSSVEVTVGSSQLAQSAEQLSQGAIEAARAGVHGKGFAVIASEVGKLAAVSQQAAADILELATESVNKANSAGEKIKDIVPDIRRTADLVAEISESSNEQNLGAGKINQAMLQLDLVIQQNAASDEEASSMSEELTSQAERLREMISFFKLDKSAGESQRNYSAPAPGKAEYKAKKAPEQVRQPVRKTTAKLELPPAREDDGNRNDELDSEFIEF